MLFVQARHMTVGREYEMHRGPTHGRRLVTLLSKIAPSGKSRRVLVRIEDGVGAGSEREVSTQWIHELPGARPTPSQAAGKPEKRRVPPADPNWLPAPGDAVAWSQTLGSRFTVLSVDAEGGIARIEGVVMQMVEKFDAPVSELSRYQQPRLVVRDAELEDRLRDRLPKKAGHPGGQHKSKPPRIESIEEDEDLVERLVFSLGCIDFYRHRFAKGSSPQAAEERLRKDLRAAKKIRKRHTREYLRLRVPQRFDVVLMDRPLQGDIASCYVSRLQLPAKSRRHAA